MTSPFGDAVKPRAVKTTTVKVSPFGDPVAEQPRSAMSKIAAGVMDVARSARGAPRYALEGLAGMGGDLYDLGMQGAASLADKTLGPRFGRYVREEHEAAPNPVIPGWGELPTSQDVRERFTNPMFGEPYEPQTKGGNVAREAVSMVAPSTNRANILRHVIAPVAGMEAGAAVGEQLGNETLGRLLGGVGGALTPGTASELIAGGRLNPERERLVRALTERGVELTAGQASGRKALQYAETGPYASKPAGVAQEQGEQFNRAALREAGIDADRMTPETVLAARDNFGQQYEDLIRQTGGVPMDETMMGDLVELVDRYKDLKGVAAAPAVDKYLKRISDAARDNADVIPTDVFRQIRSDIAKDLRKLKDDPTLSQALRDFQDSLYDSIGRNAAPGTEEAWRDINRRYRNFKTIEKSMRGPGEGTAEGMITPKKLRAAAQNADPEGYLVERGDLDTLAKAGENVMTDLPQSGTAGRALLPYTMVQAGGHLMAGQPLAAAGTALSGLAFPAVSSALTSRPVRTALVRNITGQGPLPIDPITAALLMRQQETGGQ